MTLRYQDYGLKLSPSVQITVYNLYMTSQQAIRKWGKGVVFERKKKKFLADYNGQNIARFFSDHIQKNEMYEPFTDDEGNEHENAHVYFQDVKKKQEAIKKRLEEDGTWDRLITAPRPRAEPRPQARPTRGGKSGGAFSKYAAREYPAVLHEEDESSDESSKTSSTSNSRTPSHSQGDETIGGIAGTRPMKTIGGIAATRPAKTTGGKRLPDPPDIESEDSDDRDESEDEPADTARGDGGGGDGGDDDDDDIDDNDDDEERDESEDELAENETLNPVDQEWNVEDEHYAYIQYGTKEKQIMTFNSGCSLFASILGCYLASVHPSPVHLPLNKYAEIDVQNPNLKCPFLHNITTLLIYNKKDLIILCKLRPHYTTENEDGIIREYRSFRDSITQDHSKLKYTLLWNQTTDGYGTWILSSTHRNTKEKTQIAKSIESKLDPPYCFDFIDLTCRDARNASSFQLSCRDNSTKECGYYGFYTAHVEDIVDDVYHFTNHSTKEKYKCFRTSSNWVVAEFDSVGAYKEMFVSETPSDAVEPHPRNVLKWNTRHCIGAHVPKQYPDIHKKMFILRSHIYVTESPVRAENRVHVCHHVLTENDGIKIVYTTRENKKMHYSEQIPGRYKYGQHPPIEQYSTNKPNYFPDVYFAKTMHLIECKQELVIYSIPDNKIIARLVWSDANNDFRDATTQLNFENYRWNLDMSSVILSSLHNQLPVVGYGFFLCVPGQNKPSHYCTHSRNVDAFNIDSHIFEKNTKTKVFHMYKSGDIIMRRENSNLEKNELTWIARYGENSFRSRTFHKTDLDFIHPIYSTFTHKENIPKNQVKITEEEFEEEKKKIDELKKTMEIRKMQDLLDEQIQKNKIDKLKADLIQSFSTQNEERTRKLQDQVTRAEANLLTSQSDSTTAIGQLQARIHAQQEEFVSRQTAFEAKLQQDTDERIRNLVEQVHALPSAPDYSQITIQLQAQVARMRQAVHAANSDAQTINTMENDARQLIERYDRLFNDAQARSNDAQTRSNQAQARSLELQSSNVADEQMRLRLRRQMEEMRSQVDLQLQEFIRASQNQTTRFNEYNAAHATRVNTALRQSEQAAGLLERQTAIIQQLEERERTIATAHETYINRIQELGLQGETDNAALNALREEQAALALRIGGVESAAAGRDTTNGLARRDAIDRNNALQNQINALREQITSQQQQAALLRNMNDDEQASLPGIRSEIERLRVTASEANRQAREASALVSSITSQQQRQNSEQSALTRRVESIHQGFRSLSNIHTPELIAQITSMNTLLSDYQSGRIGITVVQPRLDRIETELNRITQTTQHNTHALQQSIELAGVAHQMANENRQIINETSKEIQRAIDNGFNPASLNQIRESMHRLNERQRHLESEQERMINLSGNLSNEIDTIATRVVTRHEARPADTRPEAGNESSVPQLLRRNLENTQAAIRLRILNLHRRMQQLRNWTPLTTRDEPTVWRDDRNAEITDVENQINAIDHDIVQDFAAHVASSDSETIFINSARNLLQMENRITRDQFLTMRIHLTALINRTFDQEMQVREATRTAQRMQTDLLASWQTTLQGISTAMQEGGQKEKITELVRQLRDIAKRINHQQAHHFRGAISGINMGEENAYSRQMLGNITILMNIIIPSIRANTTTDQMDLERQLTEIINQMFTSSEEHHTKMRKRLRTLSNSLHSAHSMLPIDEQEAGAPESREDAPEEVRKVPSSGGDSPRSSLARIRESLPALPRLPSPGNIIQTIMSRISPIPAESNGAAGRVPANPVPDIQQVINAAVDNDLAREELDAHTSHAARDLASDNPVHIVWLERQAQLRNNAVVTLRTFERLETESGGLYRQEQTSRLPWLEEQVRRRRVRMLALRREIRDVESREAVLWTAYIDQQTPLDVQSGNLKPTEKWKRKYNRWQQGKEIKSSSSGGSSTTDTEELNEAALSSGFSRPPRPSAGQRPPVIPNVGSHNWIHSTSRSPAFQSLRFNKDHTVNKVYTSNSVVKNIKAGIIDGKKPPGLTEEEWNWMLAHERRLAKKK